MVHDVQDIGIDVIISHVCCLGRATNILQIKRKDEPPPTIVVIFDEPSDLVTEHEAE